MYRRTHASEIAAQEASLRQAREKAARAAQASAATRAQDEARAARRRAEQRAEERSRAVEELRTAREEYERKWNELRANGKRNGKDKAKDDDDDEQGPLYFSDLPWPTMPAGPGRALSLSKDAISHFLLSATTPDKTTDDPRTRLRAALLSYHPDRYLSAGFFKRVPEEGGQRDRVRECVNRVAQVLGELMDGVRQRESKEKEMGAKGGKG